MPRGVYIRKKQENLMTKQEINRRYYYKHLERIRKYLRDRVRLKRKNNPEWAKQNDKKWHLKYKDKRNEYIRKRMKRDIRFRLRKIFSSSVSTRLKRRLSGKNCKSTFDYLDYTIDDLMKHLENRFRGGMSWANYGEWHIDHKIPDCMFKYGSPKDKGFRQSWALKNLQPLWAEENFKKGFKLMLL